MRGAARSQNHARDPACARIRSRCERAQVFAETGGRSVIHPPPHRAASSATEHKGRQLLRLIRRKLFGLTSWTPRTPGHQDFSPVGFQRGHLPHAERGPQRGNIGRRPPRNQRGHRGVDPFRLGLLHRQRSWKMGPSAAGIDTVKEVQIPVADGVADQNVACYDGSGCA